MTALEGGRVGRAKRHARWAGAVVTLAAVAACGGTDATSGAGDPPDGTVLRQVVDTSRRLELTEEVRLGSVDDPETSFFRVTGAAVDDGGSLYVLEAGNARISVFDEEGRLLRRFGRQGEGPGDLSRPQILWLSGDTLGVGDTQNRVHFFRTDGTHLLTRAYLDLATPQDRWTTTFLVNSPAGWLLTASAYFQIDERGRDSRLPPLPRMRLLQLDARGDLRPAGFEWAGESQGRWSGMFWLEPPLQHRPTWVVDGLGRVHVAETGEYAWDSYDADGARIRRVENDVPRVPVTDDLIDLWRASRCVSGPECDPARDELALSMGPPELRPVVGRIYGFVHGHTAVRRADTDPDPFDNQLVADMDFFDPDGRYLGTVPPRRTPWWFDGRTLVVTERDEQGVEYVVRYRVQLPDA